MWERKFKMISKKERFFLSFWYGMCWICGAELWGWSEKEGVERLQELYIKWSLELDKQTPQNIVLEY